MLSLTAMGPAPRREWGMGLEKNVECRMTNDELRNPVYL